MYQYKYRQYTELQSGEKHINKLSEAKLIEC